jgi:GT2 family glycosyltransferase
VVSGTDTFSRPLGLRSIGLNNTDLSIIIVNYKSWQVLQKCLDSFKVFPPKLHYEIIVVDNDSQDGEFYDFSKKNPQIKLIKNSGNNGFSNGCNLGANYANSDYLLFLNPDILLTSSPAIDSMVEFIKHNSDTGISSCRTINPRGNPEREIAFLNPWLTIGWLRALYRLINKKKISKRFLDSDDVWHPEWVAGSVITIEKNFFNQIGKWSDQDFWMYFEDPDLCKKTHDNNKSVALLRSMELKHAHGGSSRCNPKTVAITKSEVVTSSHVFIQKYTKGFNKIALHTFIIIDTLISWILRTLVTLPIFWKDAFKENILTLAFILRYYFKLPIRRTWKSNRLINNG